MFAYNILLQRATHKHIRDDILRGEVYWSMYVYTQHTNPRSMRSDD